MSCQGTNAKGEPCESPEHAAGYCWAHHPDNTEFMKGIASKGGKATARKHDGGGFTVAEIAPIATLEDAKLALDHIRIAVMTRRLTHAEGNAASKATAEWVKAESAAATGRLVNELRVEMELKTEEIEALRKQLNASGRGMRVAH